MTTTTKTFTVTLLVLLTIDVRAQSVDGIPYVDAVGAYSQAQIMRHRGDEADKSKAGKPRKATALATPRASRSSSQGLAGMTFARSPQVTTAVNTAVVDVLTGGRTAQRPRTIKMFEPDIAANRPFQSLLARQLGPDRAHMSKTLQSGVLQRQYGQYLAASGYSAGDVGDVQNAFLVDVWSVANGGAMPDRTAVYGALRDKLRSAFAGKGRPPPPSLDNGEKQEAAETFALLGVLLNRAWRSADTAAERATLRAGAGALGKRMGMDVRAFALTEQGFVAR